MRFRRGAPVGAEMVGRSRAAINGPTSSAAASRGESGRRSHAARAAAVARIRPIEATLAERYLREHRGIDGPLPCELRFHPAVRSGETGSTHPAMLVPAFEGDEIRRVQAVLLDPETAAKASVKPAKLTFGRDAAHVPAVFAPIVEDERIYLAEGPEDAITVWSVTGCRTLVAFGASSLEKIELPPGTDLTICADADDTGIEAAHRAARAHADAGCRVRIAFPGLQ